MDDSDITHGMDTTEGGIIGDLEQNQQMNHHYILKECRVLVFVKLEGRVKAFGKCKQKSLAH